MNPTPVSPGRARIAGRFLAGSIGLTLTLGLLSFTPLGGLSLSATPGPLAPGDTGTVTVTGDPGDLVLVMIDTELGGSVLPFLGGIPIDLGQTGDFRSLFRVNTTGTIQVTCLVECEDEDFFGTTFYLQAVSLDPLTREVCVSNVDDLLWEDDGSCTPDGCTPGYWRQEHHYDDWTAPYTPGTPFSDVFDDAFPGETLGEVVDSPGPGLEILGFHTVAALLNAASPEVGYPLTPQEVIDKFDAVYPGTTEEYLDLKDELAGYNEAGCPLN